MGTRTRLFLATLAGTASYAAWEPPRAAAQAACCLPSGCVPAADQAACAALGGVYLAWADCEDDPCSDGACCAGLTCFMTDAFSCLSAGREFMGAGTDCADDPCEIGVGACCLDGTCSVVSPEDCSASGGAWLGPGTNCAASPCMLGACCVDSDCLDVARFECDALDGDFHAGTPCLFDPCSDLGDCPADSLYAQSRDVPSLFTAYTSEARAGLRRFDNFSAVAGAVESITWWGLDMEFVGGGFIECEELDNRFEVSFHADAGGVPGQAVCAYELVATRTPTGIYYLGAELNEYRVTLPEPCVRVNGWISLVGRGDPDCWFLWMSGGIGDSYCQGCEAEWESDDLSFCLVGSPGGVFGACCDEPAGICADDVEITDCLAQDHVFAPDATCDSFDPPCGVILGACCFDDATCSDLTDAECQAQGGNWLGAHTPCWLCPCLTPCPPEGAPEGEPVCYDGYIDTFNGGCDAASPAFSRISVCETVCGQSGVFQDGPDFSGDFDWYEITVDYAAVLTWTVEAELPAGAWIVDGNAGCAGAAVLTAEGGAECTLLSPSVEVQPGTYWLVVGPTVADDLALCGAHYVATATQVALEPADMDGDNDVDHDDFVFFYYCLTGPDGGLDPQCAAATFGSDCDVDLFDFAGFQKAFTGSAP